MISLISIANWLRLKHFRKNQDGVSAVEFALIAPILILFYLGAAEVSMALLASRRTDHIASSIGDLAAQSDTISHADISDLWNIADGMLDPMPSGAYLKLRLSSVTMKSDNKAYVDWSEANANATAYNTNSVIATISTTELPVGESMIMTEVNYDYNTPVGRFFPGTTSFSYRYYNYPRNGSKVVHS